MLLKHPWAAKGDVIDIVAFEENPMPTPGKERITVFSAAPSARRHRARGLAVNSLPPLTLYVKQNMSRLSFRKLFSTFEVTASTFKSSNWADRLGQGLPPKKSYLTVTT